jgi:predicted SprT family Zn-dependent metalloprotease
MKQGVTDTAKLIPLLQAWAQTWGVPDLPTAVNIRFSHRLRRSLGLCKPSQGIVTLSAKLETGAPEVLAEVLCHEVAHIAVYRLHGAGATPHGKEWQKLVSAAGFEPRVFAPGPVVPRARRRRQRRYEHRCEVCHSVRYGGRPVPQWRCAECLDAGLAGTLTIIPHDPRGDAL